MRILLDTRDMNGCARRKLRLCRLLSASERDV